MNARSLSTVQNRNDATAIAANAPNASVIIRVRVAPSLRNASSVEVERRGTPYPAPGGVMRTYTAPASAELEVPAVAFAESPAAASAASAPA